jgi:hypothetical protein
MKTLHQERAFSTVNTFLIGPEAQPTHFSAAWSIIKSSKSTINTFLSGLKHNQHISQLSGAQ